MEGFMFLCHLCFFTFYMCSTRPSWRASHAKLRCWIMLDKKPLGPFFLLFFYGKMFSSSVKTSNTAVPSAIDHKLHLFLWQLNQLVATCSLSSKASDWSRLIPTTWNGSDTRFSKADIEFSLDISSIQQFCSLMTSGCPILCILSFVFNQIISSVCYFLMLLIWSSSDYVGI